MRPWYSACASARATCVWRSSAVTCSQRPFATSQRSAITAASAESRFRTCCWLAIWFFSCSNSALAASSFSSVLGSATATWANDVRRASAATTARARRSTTPEPLVVFGHWGRPFLSEARTGCQPCPVQPSVATILGGPFPPAGPDRPIRAGRPYSSVPGKPSARAMSTRWISLVPSPISSTLASR